MNTRERIDDIVRCFVPEPKATELRYLIEQAIQDALVLVMNPPVDMTILNIVE